jgi:hypothetical protein
MTQRDCEEKEIVAQKELLNHIKHRNRGFTVLNMIIYYSPYIIFILQKLKE